VRVTFYPLSKTFFEEVLVSGDWKPAHELETALVVTSKRDEESHLANRIQTRLVQHLGRKYSPTATLSDVTEEDLEILKMSQKVYNLRFRPSTDEKKA
jgi:hypothetical protein